MKKLNWKEKRLQWWDDNERAEILESRTSNDLYFNEVQKLYNDDFYLQDEEGFSLDLKDIDLMLTYTIDEFKEKLTEESKKLITEEIFKNEQFEYQAFDKMYETYVEGWNLSDRDKECTEFYSNPNLYIENFHSQFD